MKKQDLYEILDEIYLVDASLKHDEKKLIDMLTLFSKSSPNIKPSLQFKKELKQVILLETMKKSEKLQFFSYIKMASFILSGALGVYLSFFIFAPFFNQDTIVIPPISTETIEVSTGTVDSTLPIEKESIQAVPQSERKEIIESKPKVSTETSSKVETEKSVPKEPEINNVKSFKTTVIEKGEIAFGKINEEEDSLLQAPAQMNLMMSEQAIVGDTMDSSTFSKMAPVSDEGSMITAEAPPEEIIPPVEKKYNFKGNLAINIPEKMYIYKNITKQNISIKEKGDKNEILRVSLLIDGKEVYTEFGESVKTYMYDVEMEKSLYPLNQDIKNILKTDEITAGVIYSYENLKNPILIYVLKNDFYIPAIKFTTENGENKIFELVK